MSEGLELELARMRQELQRLAERVEGGVPQLFKLPKAAKLLDMGLTPLKQAISRGEIRAVKLEGSTHLRISSVEIARLCRGEKSAESPSSTQRRKKEPSVKERIGKMRERLRRER